MSNRLNNNKSISALPLITMIGLGVVKNLACFKDQNKGEGELVR